jgi:hypothetical protein
MTAHVFVGPTLYGSDRPAQPDLVWQPPAQFGDVVRSVRAGVQAILIIDGYFDHTAAVWHKEILWALQQGVQVFGASSMGALRAAELNAFGMTGVGAIYRQFASGELEDDDEVALVHGPAEEGYCTGSEAMVNLRATLALAVAHQICTAAHAELAVSAAKRLFYPERTWPRLFQLASDAGVPRAVVAQLRDWVPSQRVDQKRLDAVEAIAVLQRWLAGPRRRFMADFHFEATDAWLRALEAIDRPPGVASHNDAALRRDDAWWAVVGRGLALQRASALGVEPDEAALRTAISALCRDLGLEDTQAWTDWTKTRGLSREQLWRFVREEAQLRWLAESLELIHDGNLHHYRFKADVAIPPSPTASPAAADSSA